MGGNVEEPRQAPHSMTINTAAPTPEPHSLPTPTPSTEDTWERDWGLFLRLARQVAGLSLTELAARAGLSKGYLSKLESGSTGARNPSRATLAALARALPSFRALAHVLDPGLTPTPLAPSEPPPPSVPSTGHTNVAEAATSSQDGPVPSVENAAPQVAPPLRLGWRELEVVLVVTAFDRGALPYPITAVVIARALERPLADVAPTLNRLVEAGVLLREGPRRPGGPDSYVPSAEMPRRLGIARVGDALVLAAALLAGASPSPATRMRHARAVGAERLRGPGRGAGGEEQP